ncbi:hypothetical protein, partial [Microbacterium sp. ZW T5_56]|uniref:hypothetical protein n=1 Tax=Microbacterium sp. ZW T5_56 TaxID=3378081 RepID=UPI003854D159
MKQRSSASISQTSAAPLAIATAILLVLVISGATLLGNGEAGAAVAPTGQPTASSTPSPRSSGPIPSGQASP